MTRTFLINTTFLSSTSTFIDWQPISCLIPTFWLVPNFSSLKPILFLIDMVYSFPDWHHYFIIDKYFLIDTDIYDYKKKVYFSKTENDFFIILIHNCNSRSFRPLYFLRELIQWGNNLVFRFNYVISNIIIKIKTQ